jgi:hypothetical protein
MNNKFVYTIRKPKSNIMFFSVNLETVKHFSDKEYIINCKKYSESDIKVFKGEC